MECDRALDMIYDTEGAGILDRIRLRLHLILCPDCAEAADRFAMARDALVHDFFPPAPGIADAVMTRIMDGREEIAACEFRESKTGYDQPRPESLEDMDFYHWFNHNDGEDDMPGGISTRGWVITGIVAFFSLASAFLGMDFVNVAAKGGAKFLLPVGITIGVFLTVYGSLFIGSHLEELSERFGLR